MASAISLLPAPYASSRGQQIIKSFMQLPAAADPQAHTITTLCSSRNSLASGRLDNSPRSFTRICGPMPDDQMGQTFRIVRLAAAPPSALPMRQRPASHRASVAS